MIRAILLTALLAAGVLLHGQTPERMLPHAGLPGLHTVSPDEYRDHLQALLALVGACQRSDSACDPKSVGEQDDYVQFDKNQPSIERYGWLRDLFEDRNDPGRKRRAELLPHAAQRLTEQITEVDAPVSGAALTNAEKTARAAVLARSEFRTAENYSWSDRLAAWFSDLMNRLFGGVASLGRMAPWIGATIQWGTLLIAAALLFFWIYRTLDRQRIAIGRLDGNATAAQQDAESRAWAEQARAFAEQGAWRDAVHCLYWASIVLLEDRRTLRRNATRTPREALRLIHPASHLREPLREQTGAFERIWYGFLPATSSDYSAALRHYQTIEAGRQPVTVTA